jgi:hypothetical protein
MTQGHANAHSVLVNTNVKGLRRSMPNRNPLRFRPSQQTAADAPCASAMANSIAHADITDLSDRPDSAMRAHPRS